MNGENILHLKGKHFCETRFFKNANAYKRVMEKYRQEELSAFDPKENFEYYLKKLEQSILQLKINWKSEHNEINSLTAAEDILSGFKQWVEYNKGWEVIQEADSRKKEKILQRVIHLSGTSYIKANNLDMSCEPDEGRGPVDFKISRGQDITIVEVKLTSNNQYLHGFEVQIEEYGKAEQTDNLVYVLVDLGNPEKVQKVCDLRNRKVDEDIKVPKLVIIDATKKESASRA